MKISHFILMIFIILISCTSSKESVKEDKSSMPEIITSIKVNQNNLYGRWVFIDYEIIKTKTHIKSHVGSLILKSILNLYDDGRFSLKMGRSREANQILGHWELNDNDLIVIDTRGNKSIWKIEWLDEVNLIFTSEDENTNTRFKCQKIK